MISITNDYGYPTLRSTILEGWSSLPSIAKNAEVEIQGRFSIGCHPSVAIYSLPLFINQLLTDYPELEIDIHHGLSREVLENVVSFRTDFGLVINPTPHPDLTIRQICEDRVSFYRAKDNIEDVLIYDPALEQSQSLMRKLKADNPFKRHIRSSNLELIAVLTSAKCGVGILPARVAELHKSLVLAHPKYPYFSDRLCLVYRADRRLSAGAKQIKQLILGMKFK